METLSNRKLADFTPFHRLAKKGARGAPKHVGIIVAPTGDPEAPFVGLVTVDNKAVVRTDLDRTGAAAFAAEAMTRINDTLPGTHLQSLVEMEGDTWTGIIVPTPPRPPKDEELAGIMAKVFQYQRELLQQLASQDESAVRKPGKLGPKGRKVQVRAKATVRAKTTVRKGAVRAKSSVRAKKVR